ncbi:hypothetical protein [Streptomyces sp. NPDC096153]|uniref:hypothetical protein n=1 Tax=Streptomyces sp. NPDC096153 TaxID=3155548 RepID=UPI0033190961
MYAIGKAARRSLTERLAAHNLRQWHLTVMAMVADLGPRMKTLPAARLDMNSSDLLKIDKHLVKTGHVVCARDPANRRRILVRLTPRAGRTWISSTRTSPRRTTTSLPLSASRNARCSPPCSAGSTTTSNRARPEWSTNPPGTSKYSPAAAPTRTAASTGLAPAEEIAGFVQARRPLHPNVFTHREGRRLEVPTATVSRGLYSGEPGPVLHGDGEGVVIVTGADYLGGGRPGLVLHRLRNEHGSECRAEEYFTPGHA